MSISNNITFVLIRSYIKFIEMRIEKKMYIRQTCQIRCNQISIYQVNLSAWHMHNLSDHDDLLVVLSPTVIEHYWKRRYYTDICEYSVWNEKGSFVLTLSSIRLTVHQTFHWWFFTRAVTAFTLRTWANCYYSLMLFATASSYKCATNEPSGSGYKPIRLGQVSISWSFQK